MIEVLREGVKAAISAVLDRWRLGVDKIASVILPTRYGKSDVIKLAALGAIQEGLADFALVMSPSDLLADQILDDGRMAATLSRASLKLPFKLRRLRLVGAMFGGNPPSQYRSTFRPNGEHLLSITSQLAFMHRELLCDWLEAEKFRSGKAPIIIVDECDQVAGDDGWKDVCVRAQSVGCRFLVLTATPQRADRDDIFGFDYVNNRADPVLAYQTRHHENPDLIWVDKFSALHGDRQLVPTYVLLYPQAYDEKPSPIARACVQWVEVELEDGRKLHDLSRSEAKQNGTMSSVVADERVIKDCLDRAVIRLSERRLIRSETSMLVFVGSDLSQERGREDRRNARKIKDALKRMDPALRVEIIERGDKEIDNADDLLRRFRDERNIDVAIVKQMGAVGMDSDRIKVVVDLSPVRQLGSCIQRWFRGGTVWGEMNHFDLILPKDPMAMGFYEFVRDHKEASRNINKQEFTDIGERLKSYEKLKDPDTTLPISVSGSSPGGVTDTGKHTGFAHELSFVDRVRFSFPNEFSPYTDAEIAEGFRRTAPGDSTVDEIGEDTGEIAKKLHNQILAESVKATRYRSGKLQRTGMPKKEAGERAGKDIMKLLAAKMRRESAAWKHEFDLQVLERFLEAIKQVRAEELRR